METLNQKWQFVSEIELIYKTKIKNSERPQIKSLNDAYKLVLSAWDYNKIEFFEQFKILLLFLILQCLPLDLAFQLFRFQKDSFVRNLRK